MEVQQKTNTLHYGYVVVIGGFLTQLILMIGLQGASLMLPSIQESLQVSYTEVAQLSATFSLTFGGFAFFWGWLADRIGIRMTMFLSSLVCALFAVLFGLFGGTSIGTAVILYALLGFGTAGIYSATVPKLVGTWFTPQKTGHAMRIVTSGGVLCGFFMGFFVPALVNAMGWGNAFVVLGVIILMISMFLLLTVRNDPAEKGLTPCGSPEGTPVRDITKKKVQEKGKSQFGEVLKMKVTWVLFFMYNFWRIGYVCTNAFLAASIKAAGFSLAEAGIGMSIYNICGLIAMQVWGPLSDKMERKQVLAICAFGMAVISIGYYYMWGSNLMTLYVFAGLMGIFINCIPVFLSTFSDVFPAPVRGTGSGLISTVSLIGGYFGPTLGGLAGDTFGKISAAFIVVAVGMIIAAVIGLLLLPNRKDYLLANEQWLKTNNV